MNLNALCGGHMTSLMIKEIMAQEADNSPRPLDGDPIFHQAFEAVRRRYDEEAWASLDPRARTKMIYQEIRQRDAARTHVAARILSVSNSPRAPQPALPAGISGRNRSYSRKPIRLSSAGS